MEPNKIEKHIKKVLKDREITPSKLAWESISKELNSDIKPSKKGFYWYGIAASVLIIITFSLFFSKEKDTIPANTIVIEGSEKNTFNITKSEDVFLDTVEEEEITENIIKNQENSIKVIEQIFIVDLEENQSLERVNAKILESNATETIEETLINAKVLEVVAHVDSLEMKNIDITEAEVDALLRNAQKDILINKKVNESDNVDAIALLTDIEDELDQSFRDKLFGRLKTGFVKVRMAVANNDH